MDIFENKLFLFLAGLCIILICLLISILRVRKLYWATTRLSKKKKRVLEKERTWIIFIIACITVGAITLLMVFTIGTLVALIFAITFFSIIGIVYIISNSAGGGGSSQIPSGYL